MQVFLNNRYYPLKEIAVGPEWKRLSLLSDSTKTRYADTAFGSEPALEETGDQLIVLKPENLYLYLQMFWLWVIMRPKSLFSIHAATAMVEGVTCLFVAGSGCGKSTLSLALNQYGAENYGDEWAFFHLPNYELYAWPFPLHLRPDGYAKLGLDRETQTWHELKPNDPKCLVDVPTPKSRFSKNNIQLFFLDGFYQKPELSPIAGGDAARRILRGMSFGSPDVFERLSVASELVNRSPCHALKLGDPRETAKFLYHFVRGLS